LGRWIFNLGLGSRNCYSNWKVKTVSKFEYLGSILESNGATGSETEAQTSDGTRVTEKLDPVLCCANILNKTEIFM
jgi:hypothetical protein